MISVFSGVDPDTLRGYLADAQQAYAELSMGKQAVSLSYTQGDGARAITRRLATPAEAMALIVQLQTALGIRSRRCGPMEFQF